MLRGPTTATSTVIKTFQTDTTWWNRPPLGFVDTTAPPGSSQTYRIRVTDPSGNTLARAAGDRDDPGRHTAGRVDLRRERARRQPELAVAPRRGERHDGVRPVRLQRPDPERARTTAASSGRAAQREPTPRRTSRAPHTGTVPGCSPYWQSGPQTFSLEAWVKTSTTTGGKIIGFGDSRTGRSSSNGNDRNLYMNNAGQFYFGVRPDMGTRVTINSPSTYRDNQWHYVVATLGADGMKLYVDGNQVAANANVKKAQVYRGYWRVGGDHLSIVAVDADPRGHQREPRRDRRLSLRARRGRIQAHYPASGHEAGPAPPATTTTLTSNLNPAPLGATVTFTATVAPASADGTVQFAIDDTPVGSAVVLSGGVASFSTAGLAAGSHQITANYSGSADFTSSASSITQQVDPPPPTDTTTALTSSLNPAPLGATVKFTATVTPTPTAGTVQVRDRRHTHGQHACAQRRCRNALGEQPRGRFASDHRFLLRQHELHAQHRDHHPTGRPAGGRRYDHDTDIEPQPRAVRRHRDVHRDRHTATDRGHRSVRDRRHAFGERSSRFSGGVATLSSSGLSPGTHQITATYSGSANFEPSAASTTQQIDAPPPPADHSGYWMVGVDGKVFAFGDVPNLGGIAASDVVDLEPTPTGNGYWIATRSGTLSAFGDAPNFGDARGQLPPGERVVSMSTLPGNNGYWLFTDLGHVLPFGAAPFLGDLSATRLNGPVLGSISTPSGAGYYMVASDGGVFSYGDAAFHGSIGGARLNKPVVGLVPDPDNAGYWLVASDGGLFAFDAGFFGSMGGARLNQPVIGMVALRRRLPDGRLGRRHLQLLRQAVLRLARRQPAPGTDRLGRRARRTLTRPTFGSVGRDRRTCRSWQRSSTTHAAALAEAQALGMKDLAARVTHCTGVTTRHRGLREPDGWQICRRAR